MKIQTIFHYDEEDTDCSCDYYSVDVKIDGKIVKHWGDHYHDKGMERAESFVEGVKFCHPEAVIMSEINKPDGKP